MVQFSDRSAISNNISNSLFHPPYLVGLDPADQVFFHIAGAGRNVDREEPCPLAWLDRPVVGVEPERPRALSRRAVEERRSRHAQGPAPATPPARRRRSGRARSPGCRFRPRRGRPTRRNPRSAASRRPCGCCCAGRSRASRRARRVAPDRPSSSARRARRATRASRKPQSSRYWTGLTAGATQAGSHAPSSSSSFAPGPTAGPDELDLLGRFRQMHAARRERIAVGRVANRAEHQRRHRVRRVRREARAHPLGRRQRRDLLTAPARRSRSGSGVLNRISS